MKISAPVDLCGFHRNQPICGVVATAVCTGRPITEVSEQYSRDKRGNWRGHLTISDILKGIRANGVRLVRARDLFDRIEYKTSIKKFIQYTMIAEPDTVFLVFTTGHVQVCQGRRVIDQAGEQDFMNYVLKGKKIIDFEVYRVYNENQVIKEVSKQEIEEMVTINKVTKFDRANEIVRRLREQEVGRKDILAELTKELDTTWGSASTFYHRVMRVINQEKETV